MKGTAMTTTSDAKRIQFNRADKDYSAYYDGELIGVFGTFHQAEVELDAHALDLLERGLLDTVEGITTMQWQAPRTLADVAADRAQHTTDSADDPFNDGPSQAEQAASAARWKECEGGWEQYTLDPFDSSKTVRLFMPRRDVVYARPAEAVELLHSDDSARALVELKRDEAGAYDDMLPDDGRLTTTLMLDGWPSIVTHATLAERDEYMRYNRDTRIATCDKRYCGRYADIVAKTGPTEDSIYHACAEHFFSDIYSGDDSVIIWRRPDLNLPAAPPAVETIVHTPDTFSGLDGSTAAGREDAAPIGGFFQSCTICGGPHVPTRCPEVALAKYGMGAWEAYMEDRAAFLKLVQWATAARLALMGDAVAFYLSHRWGHAITGYQVLTCWAHRNAARA